MRVVHSIILLSVFVGLSMGDMGYFGTIAQNPVPVDTFTVHPFIELTCEDVLIEILPGGNAIVTADFLFTNTGPSDTVLMYFPLSVMVPTISVLWSMENITDPLEEPDVTVNGELIAVRPMLSTMWIKEYKEEGSWDIFTETLDVLTPEEPDSGLVFYLADPAYWGGLDMMEIVMSDTISDLDMLMMGTYSSHAFWKVPFEEGEQVLVEYRTAFSMRHEWGVPFFYMNYPLYTGASWAGPIGSGRITVTVSDGREFADITDWTSHSMSDATEVTSFEFAPLPGMEGVPALYETHLSTNFGSILPSALVWEFSDFEPLVSPQGWMYYYEDSDSENAQYQAELMFYPDKYPSWPSGIRVTIIDNEFEEY